MQDLRDRLPPQERNALLILFSEENQRLKAKIEQQQQTIDKLLSDIDKLATTRQ